MAVIKNNKTGMWEVRTYYKDLTGVRKQKAKRGFAKLPAKGKVAVVGGSLVLGAAAVAHVVYHHGKKVDEQQAAAEEQQTALEEQQVSADDQVPEAPAQDAEAGQQ